MLFAQRLHKLPVMKIVVQVRPPRVAAGVDAQVEEVSIHYPDATVSIDGLSLYTTLLACFRQQESDASTTLSVPPIAYKKWSLAGYDIVVDSVNCGITSSVPHGRNEKCIIFLRPDERAHTRAPAVGRPRRALRRRRIGSFPGPTRVVRGCKTVVFNRGDGDVPDRCAPNERGRFVCAWVAGRWQQWALGHVRRVSQFGVGLVTLWIRDNFAHQCRLGGREVGTLNASRMRLKDCRL